MQCWTHGLDQETEWLLNERSRSSITWTISTDLVITRLSQTSTRSILVRAHGSPALALPFLNTHRSSGSLVINAHAKAGSAARAEHVLQVMNQRYHDGDTDFKPNVRTHTSVIDAWAKSGEKGAAKRAEQILNNMITAFEDEGDPDIKPNVHTANAVCNVSLEETLMLCYSN
jgi:hypothetical protein